jgi:predicted lipid-binding transport protein (Tim44 family)
MKTYRSTLVTFAVLLWLAAVENAWARAGGGGGGSGKGGILSLIALPFFIVYSAIVTHQVRKKSRACKELLARLEKLDPAWDIDAIRHRINEVFFKVQQAWMARDQNLAKDCMSDAIFQKHKLQTDHLIEEHHKNMLENINLTQADIVDVEDFVDNRKDRFWAHIEGSMIDYTIDDTNNRVVSGNNTKAESFTELWKFVRIGNTWVLDEIDQSVSLSDLKGFEAKSDSATSVDSGAT